MDEPSGLRAQAGHLNALTEFLALRDVPELTRPALAAAGVERADVLVLFGGCAPGGWDAVAAAYQDGVADRLILVGGEGHTTSTVRRMLQARFPQMAVDERPEADLIADYIAARFGIDDPLVERVSTNCGNNLTYAEELLRAERLTPHSMILVQDPTMQRRMAAGMRRVWTLGRPRVVNFAAYRPTIVVRAGRLEYDHPKTWGQWSVEHYTSLLMGEIPRLADTVDGYGPAGKDYIAHVDIPTDVLDAFTSLRATFAVRVADDRYASSASADADVDG